MVERELQRLHWSVLEPALVSALVDVTAAVGTEQQGYFPGASISAFSDNLELYLRLLERSRSSQEQI